MQGFLSIVHLVPFGLAVVSWASSGLLMSAAPEYHSGMDWELLRSLVLLVAGAALAWFGGWVDSRRRSKAVEVEQRKADRQRRWDLGRQHTESALKKTRDLHRSLVYEQGAAPVSEGFAIDRKLVYSIVEDVDLIPHAVFRDVANNALLVVLDPTLPGVGSPTAPAFTQVTILDELADDLACLLREEEPSSGYLQDLSKSVDDLLSGHPRRI